MPGIVCSAFQAQGCKLEAGCLLMMSGRAVKHFSVCDADKVFCVPVSAPAPGEPGNPPGRRLDPVEIIVPGHLLPGWYFTLSNFERTFFIFFTKTT